MINRKLDRVPYIGPVRKTVAYFFKMSIFIRKYWGIKITARARRIVQNSEINRRLEFLQEWD